MGGTGINSGLIERLRQLRPYAKKLELAHRLDKETSGCLLVAKKYSVLKFYHDELRERNVQKKYHALIQGLWPKKINKIDLPLYRVLMPHGERLVKIDHCKGKRSLSTVQILSKSDRFSLLEVSPHTGRTHQIRVHLQSQKHPIVFDQKYGIKSIDQCLEQQIKSRRLMLHAYKLIFIDYKTRETVSVVAPYDKKFEKNIKLLNISYKLDILPKL